VVRGGESTVALRVPNHPVSLALLKQGGLSVAAPSANLFTQLSPTTASHVASGLGDAIPVLDGGACAVGIESTIVSVAADGQWQLLRPGMISEAEIAAVAGAPQRVTLNASMQDDVAATPKAPGQHALHYSPRTPLSLFKDRKSLVAACADLDKADVSCAALLIGDNELPSCQVIILPAEPEKVAEQLYDSLHRLDAMKLGRLLVELPPNTPEWAAVLDRLSRAGHQ